jgi:hypothetical protein
MRVPIRNPPRVLRSSSNDHPLSGGLWVLLAKMSELNLVENGWVLVFSVLLFSRTAYIMERADAGQIPSRRENFSAPFSG